MPELQDPDIFRTILESLQTGVYVVGREGRILFWNQGAEKITGYLRHEALGRFCRENVLSHCNDHNCVQCGVSCPIAGTLHEGKSSQGEIYFRHKKGHRVPVYMRTVAIRDPHGSVIGAAESFDEQRLVPETDSFESNLAAHHCLDRSEEHTSELQSPDHLVCRLLLESRYTRHLHSFPTRRSSDLESR